MNEKNGICKSCGCTWTTPCIDQIHGACWWMDESETVCSHCFFRLNDEGVERKENNE